MNVNTALTIAGSDPSGGAGIQADLKTFSALGVYGMSVITSVTSQNTTGVFDIFDIPEAHVNSQLDAVFTDIFPDAVKIGMVSSANIAVTIALALERYAPKNIVLDTVMVSTSGHRLISPDALKALTERLFPLADIITPNIPESEILADMKIASETDMERAAERITRKYGVNALIKGGHGISGSSDLLAAGGGRIWLRAPRIDNPNTHGTGCTLSSAIAAGLAKGMELPDAVSEAKKYISEALGAMLNLGSGSGPLLHNYRQF